MPGNPYLLIKLFVQLLVLMALSHTRSQTLEGHRLCLSLMDNDVPCQCRVVICNKCTALVGAVDSREDWACWWGRGVSVDCMWDLFELFSILL